MIWISDLSAQARPGFSTPVLQISYTPTVPVYATDEPHFLTQFSLIGLHHASLMIPAPTPHFHPPRNFPKRLNVVGVAKAVVLCPGYQPAEALQLVTRHFPWVN